uniref:U4/U6.U5 small nuclear ribonucleoprotein 27 kDa protein n=1 Tax=Apteryx owenii TaxID=8824 RepID=A0A8B9QBK9_APTOW
SRRHRHPRQRRRRRRKRGRSRWPRRRRAEGGRGRRSRAPPRSGGRRRPAAQSPRRHRSSSSSPPRLKERRDEEKKEIKDSKSKERQITEEDLQGKTEEEIEMMKMMGFASFDTTKAVHEQERRIQQTFGFHCLMLGLAGSPHLGWLSRSASPLSTCRRGGLPED